MKTSNLNTASKKSATIGRIAIIAILLGFTGSANAQTYIGDAYGARIGIAALPVNVGATIVDNPDLPSFGSGSPLTNGLLNVNALASADGLNVNTFSVLQADTINTSTVGANSVVNSFSQIEDLDVMPGLSLTTSPFGLPITLNLGSLSLVSADLVRSDTTADVNGNSGITSITNLRFGANLLNEQLQADANGQVSLLTNQRRTFFLGILGNVSENENDRPTAVAELVINDQILTNGGNTRTTNAITVNVLRGNALANGSVIVASSTAGLGAAVVPESSSIVYVGLTGLLLGGSSIARFRRTKTKN